VIATGGLAVVFHSELSFLKDVDTGLTLLGLRLLWEKNRR
jgi:pantothenate kinase type III